ncbi:MAG TPA: glutathione S-transferase [Burkholderiales bacterium]|nr:glutathione S-transferase [Burkholderiales bacterium]
MAEYTLYCFAQSGNAYKAAICLELAAADWTPRFVDFFQGETRSPAYRQINVMGEVPVLEHWGLRLSQSGAILDYLSEQLRVFGSADPVEKREILRWLLWDNHKLTSYTATYRFMRRFTPDPDKSVMNAFLQRAQTAWKVLDAHLHGRQFVVGNHMTIADLSLCGYLFWDDELGVDWKLFPNIDAWLSRIRSMPRWKHPYQLMPGQPLPANRN